MQLKRLVKGVVKVPAAAQPPHAPLPPAERILDHVPGIDKAEYGPEIAAGSPRDESSITIDGLARRVFFLCGHPRSGTHWMDNVIDRHPKAAMDGEFRFESVRNAFDDITGKGWHAASREPMKSEAERCFAESVRRIIAAQAAVKPGAIVLGDRTPRPLRIFLAGAPHFLIIRDGRDVLVSWAHQEIKNAGHNYRSGNFDAELAEDRAAFLENPEHFNERPERLLACERFVRQLVKRWRNHLLTDLRALSAVEAGDPAEKPARVRVIRYERIHADPEGERAAMYRFLGLDPAEAAAMDDSTKSRPGIAKENPHGIYRKGAVGDWERFFTPDVRRWYKETAGGLLTHLGYTKDENW